MKFCPKCKSNEVDLDMGGHSGKDKCRKCGFVGNFPEKVKE